MAINELKFGKYLRSVEMFSATCYTCEYTISSKDSNELIEHLSACNWQVTSNGRLLCAACEHTESVKRWQKLKGQL